MSISSTEAAVTDPRRIALAERGRGAARSRHHGARRKVPPHGAASRCTSPTARSLTETVEAPRGSEQKFASEADVVDKFRKLARAVFADAEIDRIAGEMVLGCDKLADIGVLVAALAN